MYEDAIVDQTRRLRDEYAGQFNHDLDAICRDLMERQARSERRVVRRRPRRPSDQPRRFDCATEQTDAAEPK